MDNEVVSYKTFNTHDYTFELPVDFDFYDRTQDDLFTTYRYKSNSNSNEILVKILKPKYRNMGYNLYGLIGSANADFGFSDGYVEYKNLGYENVIIYTPNNGIKTYCSENYPQIAIVSNNIT